MINLSQIEGQLKTEEDRLSRELRVIRAALTAFNTHSKRSVGRRQLSAAGRARIAAAQKARWAKVKAGKQNIVSMPKRRIMSVAVRKKIAAAQKARWAKFRAQNKAA
jgi:hypothetical protein